MNVIESWSIKLRHSSLLRRLSWLWSLLRPIYNQILTVYYGRRGLVRVINGMDEIRILPQWRALPEVYEPEVWKLLLPSIRPGDVIADVGAHFGLYAISLAKRTGSSGKVIAVEADASNAEVLKQHIALNQVQGIVEVITKAVTDRVGVARWHSQDTQSVLQVTEPDDAGSFVEMTTLDEISRGRKVDVILIDIEGYEEPALRGALELLSDTERRPRLIVIEVHPYNWHLCGSSSATLIQFLTDQGYQLTDHLGKPVSAIQEYGHVFAKLR